MRASSSRVRLLRQGSLILSTESMTGPGIARSVPTKALVAGFRVWRRVQLSLVLLKERPPPRLMPPQVALNPGSLTGGEVNDLEKKERA